MIVVDTNVVSELMRPSPAPGVVSWIRLQSGDELYTTSITVAEIGYGIERLPEGRRKRLLRTIAEQVFATFAEHVLPFDAAAATQYGTIAGVREQAGAPIDGFNAQVASVCRARQAALATRNLKDFQETGVDVLDPWAQA